MANEVSQPTTRAKVKKHFPAAKPMMKIFRLYCIRRRVRRSFREKSPGVRQLGSSAPKDQIPVAAVSG